jgi:phosphoglycolate phosphatase
MQPDAVVFDLDGTLADTATDIQRALNSVLAEASLSPLGVDAVRLMIGRGPEVLVRKALEYSQAAGDDDRVAVMTDSFRERYSAQGNALSELTPGANECLDQLARQEIAIGLCSNKPAPNCAQLLDDLGVLQHFSAIQGSGTGLSLKPDPEPLLETVSRLGAKNALYVGDSATDVATARAAGLPVALVKGGYSEKPAEELQADWVVDRLSELPSIWQKH